MEILEYRGIEGLVAAEVLVDDNENGEGHGYVTGDVFQIAGVAEISRTTDSQQATHYYDNIPAIVISNNSSDTVTCTVSAIPINNLAKLTGQYYDENTGAMVEGKRALKYWAIGYKARKTNGDEMFIWRYKASCNVPDQTNHTEDDSTDANGQEIVFTCISTTHKFTKTGAGAKALIVDTAKELADVSAFFSTVTTPDTLEAETDYTLTVTEAENTDITVIRNNVVIPSGTGLRVGDVLTVFVTGGTMTINGTAADSGDSATVAGNVTIVSTATI